jgi:hypothetical protein
VQQRCTCGAVLPEDARFCHKCGKPQYEEDLARLTAQESAPPPPVRSEQPVLQSPGISFKNSRAVLVSLMVAAATFVGILIAGIVMPLLAPFLLCGAGIAAARLYSNRSSEPLSTAAGARLGWMTGLWLFGVALLVIVIVAIYIATPRGWDQAQTAWAKIPQLANLPRTQHDFLMQLLLEVPFFFFVFTLLPGLGGMVGAKFATRGRHSS